MDYYTGKDYGPGQGMGYTAVMPQKGFQYKYGEDGTRYSVPIEGYRPNDPVMDGEDKSLIQSSDPATDQEIRDSGLKFMPKQKYLQNPYELPSTTPPDTTPDGGITNTDSFTGSDNPNIYKGYSETIGAPEVSSLKMSQPEFNKQLFETGPYANPYERKPGDTGLREDSDLIEKIRQNNSGLEESSDAQIMEDSRFKKMFTDYEGEPDIISQKKFNLMDYLPFGKNSLSGSVLKGINSFMPKSDIRTKNIKNYYGGSDNLDSIGRIQSGLMAGYNPVSGGFLNTITGGRYGDEPTYGLQNAYQKRIDMITKTLARQQKQVDDGKRKAVSDVLKKRRDKLRGEQGSELKSIQQSQKQKDYNTVQDAYRDDREGNTYSGGETTKGDDTSYNDPFDPGGGEKDGGFIDGSNRRTDYMEGGRAGYFFGGRVNYKTGGRIGFQGGGSDASSDDFGTSTSAPGPGDTGGEGGNNPSDGSGSQFGGGNNNDGASDNPPVTVVNDNPVDISTVTKSLGEYDIPYGVEALMANQGKLQAVLNADNILDKNLGAEFTYDRGPFSIGAYADMDGDKSLNANYTRNNSNYSFDLNDGGGQLKFTRTFANGGLAGLL